MRMSSADFPPLHGPAVELFFSFFSVYDLAFSSCKQTNSAAGTATNGNDYKAWPQAKTTARIGFCVVYQTFAKLERLKGVEPEQVRVLNNAKLEWHSNRLISGVICRSISVTMETDDNIRCFFLFASRRSSSVLKMYLDIVNNIIH